jgi:hypothetical protein
MNAPTKWLIPRVISFIIATILSAIAIQDGYPVIAVMVCWVGFTFTIMVIGE